MAEAKLYNIDILFLFSGVYEISVRRCKGILFNKILQKKIVFCETHPLCTKATVHFTACVQVTTGRFEAVGEKHVSYRNIFIYTYTV